MRATIRRCRGNPEFWALDPDIGVVGCTASSLDALAAIVAGYEQHAGPSVLTVVVDRAIEHQVAQRRKARELEQLAQEVKALQGRIRRLTEEANHG